MEKEFEVLQGKSFVVDVFNFGTHPSCCVWSLSSLPEGIFLTGMEQLTVIQSGRGLSRFSFIAVSGEQTERIIKFVRINLNDHTEICDQYQVNVNVIPSNSEEYVTFSENAANAAIPYGVVYSGDSLMKYGYPCGAAEPMVKYGYPCGAAEPMVKYGYPCGAAEPMVKYGYPCGTAEPMVKYGYPCGAAEPMVKYGYPCGTAEPMIKYGYPCGMEDERTRNGSYCRSEYPAVKYGYPCAENSMDVRAYAYPYYM